VLGPGGEQVTEYSVANGASTWVHTNAFAGGALLATYHDTDTYFALEDWLGTKRAEVSAGGCFSYFTSMPYGNGLTPGGNCADATEHHFTGKERDSESGNDYFEARYYSSAMGRFMSPDWSAKEEPVPYAQLDDPQSLNLYAYVENNPLLRADIDGHAWADIVTFVQGLKQDAQNFVNEHPRTVEAAKGLGNAGLGVATVAVSLGGEVGTGGLSTAISVVGVGAGTSTFVKGVTQVVGAATKTDVKEATEALDATRNPAGLLTTAATKGNMQAGDKAATALDVVTSVADVKDLAKHGRPPGSAGVAVEV